MVTKKECPAAVASCELVQKPETGKICTGNLLENLYSWRLYSRFELPLESLGREITSPSPWRTTGTTQELLPEELQGLLPEGLGWLLPEGLRPLPLESLGRLLSETL